MENVTSDSNKILAEKLALTRELSSLRPEVEHLRTQVEANHGLLAEKLSLQRQLNTAQVELENEKRTSARALAKHDKKMEQDEELRCDIEELRKELAKEKKEKLKAEAALTEAQKAAAEAEAKADDRDAQLKELRQELDEVQQELVQEKRERQKLEKAAKKVSQQSASETDDLKEELEAEKRERKKQEKDYTKTLAELKGHNTVLDEKLNAFRDKLRSTKEKLKEREAELQQLERAQTAQPARPTRESSVQPTQNARKRIAASVEPETTFGTPGDGFPAKKMKRAISVAAAGDVSNFSLTPFLKKRAGSMAPGQTILEDSEEDEPAPAEPTPTAPAKKVTKKVGELKSKALAPSASNKANAKPVARKKTVAPTLEKVEEASEISHSKDNSENIPVTVPLKPADDGTKKPKMPVPKLKQPRKSLSSFATFNEEPAAEKKKRKLGSNLGKTLFDDEGEARPKLTSSKGIFAARALGKSVLGKGIQQRPISGGYNMMSDEGFTFSPLKKERRNNSSILK